MGRWRLTAGVGYMSIPVMSLISQGQGSASIRLERAQVGLKNVGWRRFWQRAGRRLPRTTSSKNLLLDASQLARTKPRSSPDLGAWRSAVALLVVVHHQWSLG